MSERPAGTVEKVAELMRGIRIAMVTSVDAGGRLVSRPLSVQEVEFDGDLWFFVDREADLLTQIQANPQVNVALQGEGAWVSVAGAAAPVDDPARADELWNDVVAAWFAAEGSASTDEKQPGPADLGAVLVKVDGDTAEYWEGGGRVRTVVSLLKARLTGSDAPQGENEVVDLP
ncbi:pyridoxamine 5'-phosphate oxidase family protein [Desertihabitans brevis]|nr:pyridoxamine 5'-phosphate oxidase family protein [Desertihabitans brevis]